MGFKRSRVQIPPARLLTVAALSERRSLSAVERRYHRIMLSAGIVGLPNVGKSTLFNAVTRTHKAPAENYPFCTIDPVRDIEVINTELVLADLASLQKRHDRLQKEVRAGDKTAKNENAIIEKLLPHLDAEKPAITADLAPEEKAIARGFFLLTSKP